MRTNGHLNLKDYWSLWDVSLASGRIEENDSVGLPFGLSIILGMMYFVGTEHGKKSDLGILDPEEHLHS